MLFLSPVFTAVNPHRQHVVDAEHLSKGQRLVDHAGRIVCSRMLVRAGVKACVMQMILQELDSFLQSIEILGPAQPEHLDAACRS